MEGSSLTNEEEDLLTRSTNRPKDADTHIEAQVSYRDTITQKQTFSPMDFDCTIFSSLTLEEKKDNTTNYPNCIPITIADKTRLYEPRKQSVIIKLLGKRMGYSLLLTKIQKVWNSI